ncbi:hypothetical protein ACOMHN_005089 [Nucella lapillus]
MVTAMDTGIGEVMQTLKDEGLTDNTLVLFQSDYGSDGPRKTFIYNIHGGNCAIRVGNYQIIQGDPNAFQAKRRQRSAHGAEQASSESSKDAKVYATSREPTEGDEDKAMKAFNSLTRVAKLQRLKRKGDWTMAGILKLLSRYGPEADPSETTDLIQERPAVSLFIYILLELYKAEEVEPVLAFPYVRDPRFQELNYTDNTWCEE